MHKANLTLLIFNFSIKGVYQVLKYGMFFIAVGSLFMARHLRVISYLLITIRITFFFYLNLIILLLTVAPLLLILLLLLVLFLLFICRSSL